MGIKVLSISDNSALILKNGELKLMRCDGYTKMKMDGIFISNIEYNLDSRRKMMDVGNGIFILEFDGQIVETYGHERTAVAEILRLYKDGEQQEAVDIFDFLYGKIFSSEAQLVLIRKALSIYGDRCIIEESGAVTIDGLYYIDKTGTSNFLLDDMKFTYLCLQPRSMSKDNPNMSFYGINIEVDRATLLIIAKALFLLHREQHYGDGVYRRQVERYQKHWVDLQRRFETWNRVKEYMKEE